MTSQRAHRALALVVLTSVLSATSAHAMVTLLDKDEWKVGVYGFGETDAIVDTTRSLPETIGNTPVDRPTTYPGDNGRTQFSVRNSRFGFQIDAPKAGDWAPRGVAEFDFLGTNGGSTTAAESTLFNNPALRIRHFYGMVEADGWKLLAGQSWTLFGWQPYYFLASLSVAPVSGVSYQRTAQFTAIKTVTVADVHKISAGVSIVRPAQRDSMIPGIDAGLRYEWTGRKSGYVTLTSAVPVATPLSIGISGRLNQFEFNGTADTVSQTHLMGSAIAVDAFVPVLGSSEDATGNTLSLTGELTAGQGYSEAFPSFSGNLPMYSATTPANSSSDLNVDAGELGIDPNNGITLVKLVTFNFQLQYHLPTEWNSFVTAGYGQIYSDNIGPLTPGKGLVVYNRDETYFLNVGHNFSKALRLAAEYDIVRTTYTDSIVGHDDRGQISAFFYF